MVKPRPLHQKNGLLLAEMMRHGYTIKSLAKTTGVHYLTIWRIVNQQHRPGQATARKIATALSCSLDQLNLEIWGKPKSSDEPESPAEGK